MKKLSFVSLFLFCAFTSIAQRFEVNEQAGMSFTGNSLQKYGLANQFAAGYHIEKHLFLSAFYERNNWASINNAFGCAVDYTTHYFFVGIEGKSASLTPYTANADPGSFKYVYQRTFNYGIHAGVRYKIYKRLSAIGQLGYVCAPIGYSTQVSGGSIIYGAYMPSSAEYNFPKQITGYYYIRVGLAYSLYCLRHRYFS